MLFRRRLQPSGSALLRPDGFALHSSAVFFGAYLKALIILFYLMAIATILVG